MSKNIKRIYTACHLKKRWEIRMKTAFQSQSLVAKNHHVLESFPNHYHHNMLVHKELKPHVQHPHNSTRTGGDHDLENTQKYSNVGINTCCMHLNSCECEMQMNMLKIQLLRYVCVFVSRCTYYIIIVHIYLHSPIYISSAKQQANG